jgi:hypothetical protein
VNGFTQQTCAHPRSLLLWFPQVILKFIVGTHETNIVIIQEPNFTWDNFLDCAGKIQKQLCQINHGCLFTASITIANCKHSLSQTKWIIQSEIFCECCVCVCVCVCARALSWDSQVDSYFQRTGIQWPLVAGIIFFLLPSVKLAASTNSVLSNYMSRLSLAGSSNFVCNKYRRFCSLDRAFSYDE